MLVKDLYMKQTYLDTCIMENLRKRGVIAKGQQLLSYRLLALAVEIGELTDAVKENVTRKDKLGEYVDVLHFMLSIGNITRINKPYATITFKEMYKELDKPTEWKNALEGLIIAHSKFSNVTRCFKYWSLEKVWNVEYATSSFLYMWIDFITVGHSLGFGDEEIEEAYLKKNEINYQRQRNKY